MGYGICYYGAGSEAEGFTSTGLIGTSQECVICDDIHQEKTNEGP